MSIRSLGPFSLSDAHNFLGELADSYQLPLSDEVRAHILTRIGWPIPFYLQLMFSELREKCFDAATMPTIQDVDQVYEDLLKPEKKGIFDYWRQRLTEELGKPDSAIAIALLSTVARDPAGSTKLILSQVLSQHVAEVAEREDRLRYLLDVLVNDGYITEESDRFVFRSPLLREFWLRRVKS